MARWPDYHIDKVDEQRKIVWIMDDSNASGSVTITNAAEEVVEQMLKTYPGYRIIYRDTDGFWDELLHDGEQFTGFNFCQDRTKGIPR